jgi:hypothetical protein
MTLDYPNLMADRFFPSLESQRLVIMLAGEIELNEGQLLRVTSTGNLG